MSPGEKSLLKVANIPILQYQLKHLLKQDLKHLFVYYSHHNKSQIKAVIDSCDKAGRVQLLIGCARSNSLGEALREVSAMNVIKSDFMLVANNVVTNLDVDKTYLTWKERKQTNKQMVCMKVFKEQNSFKDYDNQQVYLLDSKEHRLMWSETLSAQGQAIIFKENLKLKRHSNNLQVTMNLRDVGISINTKMVLNYFKENFDFELYDANFIRELLTSEINDDQVCLYKMAKEEYAQVVNAPRLLLQASREVIQQWVQPYTVDKMYKQLGSKVTLSSENFNVYLDQKSHIP